MQQISVNSITDVEEQLQNGFIRRLLNSLPVQIFIKEAEIVQGKGRRYIFLNDRASELIVGEPFPERDVFDSEAYPMGWEDPGFKAMLERETITLETKQEYIHEIPWSPSSGSRWRINSTIEIPICSKIEVSPALGLIAIGQDLEFQAAERTFVNFIRSTFHEVDNITGAIDSTLSNAERLESRRSVLIAKARQLSRSANRQSQYLLKVFRGESQEPMPLTSFIEEIQDIAREMSIDLAIDLQDFDPELKIRNPMNFLAVAYEILRNAYKYTNRKYKLENEFTRRRDVTPVKSRVTIDERLIEIVFANQCDDLKGFVDTNHKEKANFGGVIISEMIQRTASNLVNINSLFEFPQSVDLDGWVNVTMRIPR